MKREIGRADEAIITSGGRIGPQEIEQILCSHPAVKEAGVVRIPSKEGFKTIKAFVSLKPEYSPSDRIKQKIKGFVEENLSPDTTPQEIEFIDSLPKDKNGNILRRVLKAWELGLPVGNINSLREK